MDSHLDRRGFLKKAGLFAGAVALPARAVAGSASNSAVPLGLIGCGGRGNWISDIFVKNTNSRIVALADLFDDCLEQAGQRFEVPANRRHKGLAAYKDLVAGDVEGVLIESPPYCHPEQALAAVEAGKHVFLAKPVAVDVPGCKTIMQAADKAQGKQSFLVDFQTRATELFIEAARRVAAGAIGAPVCGQVFYHTGRLGARNAKPEESRMRNWVFDKALSGDIIVEQNVHVLDVCNWLLRAVPLAAYGTGGRKGRTDVGDCWDHFVVTFYYPNDVKIDFSSSQFLKGFHDMCTRIYGTKGTVDTHYGATVQITGDEPWPGGQTPSIYLDGALANARSFVTGIESGKLVNNGRGGALSTQTCVLGRAAAYRQKEVTWAEVDAANEGLNLGL
jgi:myo-inositol 2-dehydrogenase / D-chiro-inositol 1-dehydrogenase